MKDLRVILLGALVTSSGCIIVEGSTTGESASGGGTTGGGTSGASETGGSTSGGSTTGASGSTSESPTSGEPTGGATTGSPAEYCNGFDAGAQAPFLEVSLLGGAAAADGATWPLECGGQGFWMFGLYPSFGGWDPGGDSVAFKVTVDVEGFNDNPDGHFYSNDQEYFYIGCEIFDGGVSGVIGVIPPDVLADLTMLDAKSATLHLEITGGGQTLATDVTMNLSAPADVVQGGCGF